MLQQFFLTINYNYQLMAPPTLVELLFLHII